jgi:hypothetical protein
MAQIYLDISTMVFCYLIFWILVILLILYPKLKLKKISKRIKMLKKKNKEIERDEKI